MDFYDKNTVRITHRQKIKQDKLRNKELARKVLTAATIAGLTVFGAHTKANAQDYENLKDAVDSTDNTKGYELVADEIVNETLGPLGGMILTIDGNNYSVNSDGAGGITVGTGQTLEINNVGDASDENSIGWSGFDGTVIDNSGDVTITDSVFSGNSKTESVTNPSGATTLNNAYRFEGGAILKVAQGATANFTGTNVISNNNYTNSITSSTSGYKYANTTGALISNAGTIAGISFVFDNNAVSIASTRTNGYARNYLYGGIIGNSGTIGDITGSFTGNEITSSVSGSSANTYIYGGLISNKGTISGVNSNFTDNSISSNSNILIYGGALYNDAGAQITSITGNYTNNYAQTGSSQAFGGIIYNASGAEITSIIGNFSGNYTKAGSGQADAGVIMNNCGIIGEIKGANDSKAIFSGNYAESTSLLSQGGAIRNTGAGTVQSFITSIYADFIGNHTASNARAAGGAIFNNNGGMIGSITANFDGNYVLAGTSYAHGGAITNERYSSNLQTLIGSINGSFTNNYVFSESTESKGGAIYMSGGAEITSISANFEGNHAQSIGGPAQGGAMFKKGAATHVASIDADFTSNYAISENGEAQGGALYNNGDNTVIDLISADFTDNYAISENAAGQGGAIYNGGTIQSISDSSFTGNASTADGGAIYNAGTVTLSADNKNVVFSDNKSGVTPTFTDDVLTGVTGGVANDVYNEGTLTLYARDGKSITFNGTITDASTPTGTISINDSTSAPENVTPTGTVNFNSTVTQNAINMYAGTANFDEINVAAYTQTGGIANFRGIVTATTFDISGGTVSFLNNAIEAQNIGEFTLAGDIDYVINVDLSNYAADTVSVVSMGDSSNKINLNSINWLGSNMALAGKRIALTGANANLANAITLGVTNYVDGGRIYNLSKTIENDIAYLNFDYANLYTAVHDATPIRTYTMNTDEPALASTLTTYGAMEGPTEGTNLGTLTIEGNGFGVIGDSKGGITVGEGQTLNINNVGSLDTDGNVVKSWNSQRANHGAVVNNTGTLAINSSVFSGNTAGTSTDSYGAVIYNSGRISNVTNSAFISNTTQVMNGGAIYNASAAEINLITGSTFRNQHAGTYGGAISNNGVVTEISDSTFISNRAAYGGAIHNAGGATIGKITNSIFTNNEKFQPEAYGGGAIINNGTITELSDLTFTGNYSNTNGGAIWNTNRIIGLTNTVFENNYAKNTSLLTRGGAISLYGGTVDLIDADFIGNYTFGKGSDTAAGAYGGAIALWNKAVINKLVGNFTNNYAVSSYNNADSGAIEVIDSSKIKYIEGSFTGNSAYSSNNDGMLAVKGGVMFTQSNSVIGNMIADFTNNYAYSEDYNAGAGAIWNEGKTTLTDSSFIGNAAKTQAGAILNKGTMNIVSDTKNVVFRDNMVGGEFTVDEETGRITGHTGGVANDIYNVGTLNLNAGTYTGENDEIQARNITFNGTITGTGTMNINKSGLTYDTVDEDLNDVTRTITQTDGTINFNDTVTQQNMNIYSGTVNIDADDLKITNDINNSAGTINLGGGTLTPGITNSNGTASNWKGTVNILGDIVLEKTINRNDLNINGNTLKYGTTSASIDVVNKNFYSETGAVLDTINNTVTHTINMGTVHLADDLGFTTDINLNVSNTYQRSDRLVVGAVGEDSTGNIVLDSINILTEGTKLYRKVYYTNATAKNIAHLADNVTITKADGVNNTYTITNSGSDNNGAYYLMHNDGIHNFVTATRYDDLTATNDVYTLTGDVNIATDLAQLGDDPNGVSSIGNIKSDREVYTINGAGYSINGASKRGMTLVNGDVLYIQNVNGSQSDDSSTNKGIYGFVTTGDGGFINVTGGGRVDSISNCVFQNNYAGTYGGVIKVANGQINIVDTDFIGNIAKDDGGAINVNAHANNALNITALTKDVHFTDNVSGHNGGAISDVGGIFTLNAIGGDIIFSGNKYKATVSRNSTTGEVTVSDGILGDIYHARSTMQLNATEGHKIDFSGVITGDGTTDIGGTYTQTVHNDETGEDETVTKTYDGAINFGNTVWQNNLNVNSGTVNIDADDLKITNNVNNSAGTINLGGGTLTPGITNSNGTASNWKGTVNILGDIVLEKTINRNDLNINGNTLKYGTTSASIDVVNKNFYSETGAVLDTINNTVTHTINMGTVHLADDLGFSTDVNLNVSNNQQRSDRLVVGAVGEDSTGNIVLDSINVLAEGTKLYTKVYYTNAVAKNIAHLADDVTITKADGVNNTYTITNSGSDSTGAYYLMHNDGIHNFVTATRYDDLTATNDVYTLTGDVNVATDLAQLGDDPNGVSSIGNIKSDREVYTIAGQGYNIDGYYEEIQNGEDLTITHYGGISVANGKTLNINNVGTINGNDDFTAGFNGFQNAYSVKERIGGIGGGISGPGSISHTYNYGGAIYNSGITNISNSVFSNNFVTGGGIITAKKYGYGGAVANVGNTAYLSVGDSVFIENSANDYGGAIANDNVVDNISNTIFYDNTASNGGAIANVIALYRGSMFASLEYGDITNITDSLFEGNIATNRGGAIYNADGAYITSITDTDFIENTALNGGAIYNEGDISSISNVGFIQNTATGDGGAINNGGSISISGVDFEENTAANGGAIFNNITDIAITYSLFYGNTASENGGAIYNKMVTALDGLYADYGVSNLDDLANVMEYSSVDVMLHGYSTIDDMAENLGFESSEDLYSANSVTTAEELAQVFGYDSVEDMLSGESWYYDSAEDMAINRGYTAGVGNITITNTSFTENLSEDSGGAIYNAGILTLNGTNTFADNTANGVGNDIYNSGTINLGVNSITNINSGWNGTSAGTAVMSSGSVLNLGASFTDNTISMTSSTINILNGGSLTAGALTNNAGSVLNAVNTVYDTISLGDFTNSGALSYAIDVALGNTIRTDLIGANTDSTGTILLNSIVLNSGTDNKYTKVTISDGNLYNLISGTGSNTYDGKTYSWRVLNDDTTGAYILFNRNDIRNLVSAAAIETDATRTYTLSGNESISDDFTQLGYGWEDATAIGVMTGANSTLTVNGAGFGVNGNGNGGITVGEGQTLNINNVGAYTTDAQTGEVTITNTGWSGFNGAAKGGVINNAGTMNITNSVFANNTSSTSGAAVYNSGTIENLNAVFSNNSITATAVSYGSALCNVGNITAINSDFINNHLTSTNKNVGGAIVNARDTGSETVPNIGSITGNFIGNYAVSESYHAIGGAILNTSIIGDITGNFIDNYVASTVSSLSYGGAIYNESGEIGTIKGNFTGNYSIGHRTASTIIGASGGAIYNQASIAKLEGDYTNNYAYNTGASYAQGGAIVNAGEILGGIVGNFSENYAFSTTGTTVGGAIENGGTIGDIVSADGFSKNYAKSNSGLVMGGAIASMGTIASISADFTENYAQSASANANGGAINNNSDSEITNGIIGNFTGNYAITEGTSKLSRGGAVVNYGKIGGVGIMGDFNGNYAQSAGTGVIGGALANMYLNENSIGIANLTGTYSGNYAKATGENGYAQGGAIYNQSGATITSITDSTFTGNYVEGAGATTGGGAIWNAGTIGFSGTNTFTNNKVNGALNDIYNSGTINFGANSTTTLNGGANGSNGVMNMASGSTLNLGGLLSDNTINMSGATINLNSYTPSGSESANYGSLNLVGLTVDETQGSLINSQNNNLDNISLGNVTLNSDLKLNIDANVQTAQADMYGATSITANGYKILIDNIKVLADGSAKYIYAQVVDDTLKAYTGLSHDDFTAAKLSGFGSYTVTYQARGEGEGGWLTFNSTDINNLVIAARTAGDDVVYAMGADESITDDLAAIPDTTTNAIGEQVGTIYTVNGGGHNVNGDGNGGIVVGAGHTFNVNNVGDLTDENSKGWYGFNGTVINNSGTVSIKNTNFTGNNGTAISNSGMIILDDVNFINNNNARLIYNTGTISGNIGTISGNTVVSRYITGGLIENYGHNFVRVNIGDISGGIKNNTITSNNNVDGGLLHSRMGNYGNISGGILNNTVTAGTYLYGGLIRAFDPSNIGNISGGISGNIVTASSNINGGLLDSYHSTIGDISGVIEHNTVISEKSYISGGIISNDSAGLSTIFGVVQDGINNNHISAKTSIYGGIIHNSADYSPSVIGGISSGIINNEITAGNNISGGLISNSAGRDGSRTSAIIGTISGNIIGNIVSAGTNLTGGLIYNYKDANAITATITLTNPLIKDNIITAGGTVTGGLIYNSGGVININAVDENVEFSNNLLNPTIVRDDETGEITSVTGGTEADIYNTGTLNLNAVANKSITIDSEITDASTPTGTINVNSSVIASGSEAIQSVGTISFNSTVTQKDMTITSGRVNIGASDLKISNGVLNNAHLNLYDGELTTSVRGDGTTHIDANDKVIVNTTITNNILSLDNGTAKIVHKDLLTLAGTIGNGGALDIANNEIENLNLGNVTLNGEDIKLSIDTNFETRVADVIDGIVISNADGNHIVIQNINAISDTVLGPTVPYGIKVAEQNIKDNIILAADFYVNSENLRNNYFITYGDSDDGTYGQLEIAFANLKTAVTNGSTQKVYTMVEDEVVTNDLGNLGGTTLSVNAGNNKITGQGTTGGISVSDGQTLTLNNVSEYSGFETVVTNNSGGTVNINNSTLKDNNAGVDNKEDATVNITDSTFNNTTTDVSNAGTMNLNGENTFNKEVSGSGNTNIQSGKTTVCENAEFTQGNLTINENAELENNNKVTVSGILTNNGDITNAENADLNINGTNSVNNGTIDNDGTVTVNAQFTNNSEITGDGTLENKSVLINGENGSVEQKTVINNGGTLNNEGTITAETITNSNGGVINSNASDLTANIENNSTLNLTGGTNSNTITGENGTTNFAGITVNNAEITQTTVTNSGSLDNNSTITAALTNSGSLDNSDGKVVGAVTNNENATLTSNASNLVGTVANNGTLILNGGTVQDTVSGSGKTVINSGTVTLDNEEITGNDIELKSGATLAIRNNGEIGNANSLIAKGGTVDLLDNATKTTDLGNIDLSNGNLNVAIDADLAAVKGDVITGEVTAEGGSILLSEVRILTDSTTRIPIEILVADTGLRSYVDLADNARTSSSQTTSYLLSYTKATGELVFEYANLENAVKSETPTKVYNMGDSNEIVNNNLGELKGNSLVVNGNNKDITGRGTTEGITVSSGQRLAINNVNNYSGFDTAITNNTGGTLDITNVDFSNNRTADINNNSVLNFYGTDSFDKVTGVGTTNIKTDTQGNGADVTVNNNGTFKQGKINVDESSTLRNNGTVTAGRVDNNGVLYNSGNLNSELANAGTVTNTGLITGNITNNENGKITSKADGLSGKITNDGKLNLTGGVNTNTITGNGTTNFSGTGSNDSVIKQQAVNNSGKFTNNGDIQANVENSGKLTNSSTGTITDITNNSNGEFINNGKVAGNTANNGVLNNNGLLSGNLTNNQNGKLNNNGNITSDINNYGIINNNNGHINSESILNNGKITTATQNLLSSNTVRNNGTITYNSGNRTYVDITGNGKINLNTNSGLLIDNKITGNQINLNNSIISFGTNGDISNARSLNVNGGGIDLRDNKITSTNLGKVNLNKNSKLTLDFNVSDETSDKLIANVKNNGGKFVVTGVNIKGTTNKGEIKVHLGDTTTLGRGNTTSTTFKLPDLETPIRRLHGNVSGGWLTYSGTGNGYKYFSPSVMASSVSTQVGGVITQNQTLQQGFYHMDRYSKYPYRQRYSAENMNMYAMSDSVPVYNSKSELPLTSEAMWTNPYTTFEKVDLKGGVEVSNVAYGTLYGGDSELKDLGHGKKGVLSAFIGYSGNHMTYDGISMNQQGGLLGMTGTLYKGNFFSGLTVSAGASAGEAHTSFGTDHLGMLTAGVANKTGYNWELKDGKIIIQPSMYLGYTFANTFDYTNSAGVRIKSDPAHSIQMAPSIKIIGNTKNGWHPYIGADMVWNIQTGGDVTAAETRLPQVTTKPYVQYGVGVQKSWGDRFTAYGQTMLRNGGRTGVVLNVGFRWTLGKDSKKETTKVMAPTDTKTSQQKQVIKQLKPVGDVNKTTRTPLNAQIKSI